MAIFKEDYELPSGGVLYNPKIDRVTVRNITTAEEKLLLGSGLKALDDLIEACIVEPKIKVADLIVSDKHFLLVKIRVVSYGNIYKVEYECPHCERVATYDVDLDKLEVFKLDADFKEPYETILPISNDIISLRIPRGKDLDEAERQAKKLHRKFPEAKGDYGYICRLMANIEAINGEKLGFEKLREYVEQMHTRDSSAMRKAIGEIKVGLNTQIIEICPHCDEDVEFILPFSDGFFRAEE